MQSPVYVLLVTLAVVNTAEAHDPATGHITNLCKEDDYLQAVTTHLSGLLSPVSSALAELKRFQKAWQIGERQAATADTRCLYTALINKAAEEIAGAEAQLEADRSTITNALFLVERQRGVLSAAHQASKLQITDAASGHDGTGKSGTAIDLNFETKVGTREACTPTKAGTRPNYGSAIPAVTKLTKMKLTKVEDIQKLTQKSKNALTGMTSGCQTTGNLQGLNGALKNCQVGGTPAASWAYTPVATHTSTTKTNIFEDGDKTGSCHSSLSAVDATKPLHEQLAKALCEALKVKPRIPNTLKTQTGATLANDDIVLLSVRNCNPKFQTIADITNADQTKDFKAYITNSYGKDAGQFEKNFITSLQATNTQTRTESKTESKKIEELAEPKSLAATISHLEGKRIKKELEAEKKSEPQTAVNPQKEEKCKDKPIEECKDENGCEFQEGKCKLKEGAKVENDGKTNTNTTGRNSFCD